MLRNVMRTLSISNAVSVSMLFLRLYFYACTSQYIDIYAHAIILLDIWFSFALP